jgi:ribulose-phosphate 3-epimerase
LSEIKQANQYGFAIQIDGGINKDNINKLIEAGAENIVIGAAAFQRGKTKSTLEEFVALVK